MKRLILVCLALCGVGPLLAVTAQESIDRLMKGNERFVKGVSNQHPNLEKRRLAAIKEQEPFAIVLGCSDSRVPPEIIFDQELDDLFVARVAGNVVDPLVLDSIEYAAIYLHAPLILVIGHEKCGAVAATLEGKTRDIETVAELIEPAVQKTEGMKGDPLDNAIKENAKMVADYLSKTPILKDLIDKKKLLIRSGYYNFHTGKVELL